MSRIEGATLHAWDDATASTPRTGILFVGVKGAVASTTIAGTLAVARGLAPPTGLVTESRATRGVPFTPLTGLRFGGWDIAPGRLVDATRAHGIVPDRVLDAIRDPLRQVECFPGLRHNVTPVVRDVAGDTGPAPEGGLRDAVDALRDHVTAFRESSSVRNVIVVNASSVEPLPVDAGPQESLPDFEAALDADSPHLTPGMLYAYAALRERCPFVEFTPNVTVDAPALQALAAKARVPVAGKDGKTGQTAYKTCLATLFASRELKVNGWFSGNLLGNRDGRVLADAGHAAGKIASKRRVLERILGYGDFDHQVRIDHYAPRGDRKEAWDVIDFEGWLGARMSMRVNWQGDDSALAAPLVVDAVRFTDLAHRRGAVGPLPDLGFYFKNPLASDEHALPEQYRRLLAYATALGAPPVKEGRRASPARVPQP